MSFTILCEATAHDRRKQAELNEETHGGTLQEFKEDD